MEIEELESILDIDTSESITPDDLLATYELAYNEGDNDGYTNGFHTGYSKGYSEGKSFGYHEGYDDARMEVY